MFSDVWILLFLIIGLALWVASLSRRVRALERADLVPVLLPMDGKHFAPVVDRARYNGKLSFVANISNAVRSDAVSWQLQDSDDSSNWTAVDSSLVQVSKDAATTSNIFNCGYNGKRRYVKAAFTSGGSETGRITALIAGSPIRTGKQTDAATSLA